MLACGAVGLVLIATSSVSDERVPLDELRQGPAEDGGKFL